MRPFLLLPQGTPLVCPDCGAKGGWLPVIDEAAGAEDILVGRRAPLWALAEGIWLSCQRCGFAGRADLDRAEDPRTPVWRVSRP